MVFVRGFSRVMGSVRTESEFNGAVAKWLRQRIANPSRVGSTPTLPLSEARLCHFWSTGFFYWRGSQLLRPLAGFEMLWNENAIDSRLNLSTQVAILRPLQLGSLFGFRRLLAHGNEEDG